MQGSSGKICKTPGCNGRRRKNGKSLFCKICQIKNRMDLQRDLDEIKTKKLPPKIFIKEVVGLIRKQRLLERLENSPKSRKIFNQNKTVDSKEMIFCKICNKNIPENLWQKHYVKKHMF